jgi:zinc D-Ala-D-Ala dipeptidase
VKKNRFFVTLISICASAVCFGQTEYSPALKESNILKEIIINDSNKALLNLTNFVPGLRLDLKYTTRKNFTKTKLYPRTKVTFLRRLPTLALAKAAEILDSIGLGIIVFDAYRPFSVTVKMWELIGDERYVANPKNGSGHNRGLAVDLTLYNKKTRKVLNMGTPFDFFGVEAAHSHMLTDTVAAANRILLKSIMTRVGFKIYDTEWWHYSWPNNNNYEVLDFSFKELASMSK